MVSEDGRVIPGNHGFDPYNSELNVPFRAEGPDFKHGYVKTAMFDNTCIYPLLSRLLGIEPAPCDGNIATWQTCSRRLDNKIIYIYSLRRQCGGTPPLFLFRQVP